MAPKKDKGKASEEPKPKSKGLTNVRSWLNVTKSSLPINPSDDHSSTSKPKNTNDLSESLLDNIDPKIVAAALSNPFDIVPVDNPDPIRTIPPTTAGRQVKLPNIQTTEVTSVPSSSQAIVPLNVFKSRFYEKQTSKFVFNVEKAFLGYDPYGYAEKIFSNKFNHLPYDHGKTNEFYQKILNEIKSVSFKHFQNDGQIAYSTARIHKIINIDEWSTHPEKP